MKRLAASRGVRIAVAAGLVGYLLWLSHPAEVARALAGARPGPLLIAVGLTLIDRSLMAWRWLALLRPIPPAQRPTFRAVMRIFFVSTFLGTFLPASLGSDAVRAYALAGERVPLALSAGSVVVDRALGVIAILLLGLTAAISAPQLAAPGVGVIVGTGAVAAACVVAAIFSGPAAARLAGLASRVAPARAGALVERFVLGIREYRRYRRTLTLVLFASMAVQVLRITQAAFLGRALGLEVPLAAYFVAIPVILLIMLLPITVNGLGTSQAAFLWAFGTLGVSRADAFSLSVLFVALGIVGNLPGGLLYALGRPQPRPA